MRHRLARRRCGWQARDRRGGGDPGDAASGRDDARAVDLVLDRNRSLLEVKLAVILLVNLVLQNYASENSLHQTDGIKGCILTPAAD